LKETKQVKGRKNELDNFFFSSQHPDQCEVITQQNTCAAAHSDNIHERLDSVDEPLDLRIIKKLEN
jgi:hypothetical protein